MKRGHMEFDGEDPVSEAAILTTLRLMDRFAAKRGEHPGKDRYPAPSPVPADARGDEKREHPRLAFQAEVTMSADGRTLSGRVGNISSTGLFIHADPEGFSTGDRIDLEIAPPDHTRTYRSVARVIRVQSTAEGSGGYGLRFLTL